MSHDVDEGTTRPDIVPVNVGDQKSLRRDKNLVMVTEIKLGIWVCVRMGFRLSQNKVKSLPEIRHGSFGRT